MILRPFLDLVDLVGRFLPVLLETVVDAADDLFELAVEEVGIDTVSTAIGLDEYREAKHLHVKRCISIDLHLLFGTFQILPSAARQRISLIHI